MTWSVTSEKNQNIIHLDKLILQWDFKLGHIGISTVQWIGRQGCLRNMGEKTGSNNIKITKCEACQYSK